MAKNFPVDDEGNWMIPTEPAAANRHNASGKKMWLKSNPIVLSFIEQVKDFAPLKASPRQD